MENYGPQRFGGEPGTPVPQVDPEDLRKVSEYTREVAKERPNTAIGVSIFEHMLASLKTICLRSLIGHGCWD